MLKRSSILKWRTIMADKKKTKMPAAVELGKLGGKKGGPARAKALKPAKRSSIAKKGADARWHKGKK